MGKDQVVEKERFWKKHKKALFITCTIAVGIVTLGIFNLFNRGKTKSQEKYSSDWIKGLSDDLLEIEREKVRVARNESSKRNDKKGVMYYQNKMNLFDREMRNREEIKYADVDGSLPHREHGWYVQNDD